MRIGFNPEKDRLLDEQVYFHQVVMPVHIPNQTDYFQDSFIVLKHSLKSLLKTSHKKTYFTVVNNGSCDEIITYLDHLKAEGQIHELVHTNSIGKLNSILKGIVGHKFSFVSVVDADVLFLNGWQEASYDIFKAFPKAGIVTTTPNPKLLKYYTGPVFFSHLFSKSLSFSRVKNPDALIKFAESIGNRKLFKDIHLKKYLTISTLNGVKAVVGAGHFVATYRGDLFESLELTSSQFALGGKSEEVFLDSPLINKGLWRLATLDNYTYHMGNTYDVWMENELMTLQNSDGDDLQSIILAPVRSKTPIFLYFQSIIIRLLFRKGIWKLYLRVKGLTKFEAEVY